MTKRGLVGLVRCMAILSTPAGARRASAESLHAGISLRTTAAGDPRSILRRLPQRQRQDGGTRARHARSGARRATNAEVWEKVVRKLRGRMMPPPGRPRPDEATYDSVVSYLETSLDRSAARPSQSRPNRHVPPAQSNRIPERDPRSARARRRCRRRCSRKTMSSHGFDNVGVGDLSPTLLERYLAAAQKVSRLAVGSPLRVARAATSSCCRRT